jgi:hypothetical protein
MTKSEFFLSWHMICREDKDNMLLCLDSLQGLYDECIVAVDDRPGSDEVFEAIQIYPNLTAYRQKWPGRFDFARQDVLTRINQNATYVGCCDSDEVLVRPSPRELRELLYNEQPRAVNLGIQYRANVGPNKEGNVYLRTKIWKRDHPRRWVGKIHEYPACQEEFVVPTPYRNIIFDHQKIHHTDYRLAFIVNAMLEDIANGHTRWYPYLGEEYRSDGQYEQALVAFRQYLRLPVIDIEHDQHIKKCLEEMIATLALVYNGDHTAKWSALKVELEAVNSEVSYLKDNPVFWEYYALSVWYLFGKGKAKEFHEKAKSLDPEKKQEFLWSNDRFYVE